MSVIRTLVVADRTSFFGTLFLGFLAAIATAVLLCGNARAVLVLPGCNNLVLAEGNPGLINCPVSNTGLLPVRITGQFGFTFRLGPDLTDSPRTILPVGRPNPVIPAGGVHMFQYLVLTGPDLPPPPIDLGINIFNVIFRGMDAIGFVPGAYRGSVVVVFDVPGVPPVPGAEMPDDMFVYDEEGYTSFKTGTPAEERSFDVEVTEPSGLLVMVAIACGAVAVARRQQLGTSANQSILTA